MKVCPSMWNLKYTEKKVGLIMVISRSQLYDLAEAIWYGKKKKINVIILH